LPFFSFTLYYCGAKAPQGSFSLPPQGVRVFFDKMVQPNSAQSNAPPILLLKWYDVTKWLLERVDSFPKNQRFIFGQRLADRAVKIYALNSQES
jgi:hypothetical protein